MRDGRKFPCYPAFIYLHGRGSSFFQLWLVELEILRIGKGLLWKIVYRRDALTFGRQCFTFVLCCENTHTGHLFKTITRELSIHNANARRATRGFIIMFCYAYKVRTEIVYCHNEAIIEIKSGYLFVHSPFFVLARCAQLL